MKTPEDRAARLVNITRSLNEDAAITRTSEEIRAAVEEERKACVATAVAAAITAETDQKGLTARMAAKETALKIADAIRSRSVTIRDQSVTTSEKDESHGE